MKALTLVKLASQSIRKNKMRTALTMLGIIIGVAAVLVMVAIGQGARSQIRAQINNLGTNMIVITPGATSQGGVSQGAAAFASLTVEDAARIAEEAGSVSAVSPVVITASQRLQCRCRRRSGMIRSSEASTASARENPNTLSAALFQ